MQLNNENMLLIRGWIDGREVSTDRQFAVINPATLESVANVSDLGAAETMDAISAAKNAFATWRTAPPQDRISGVQHWADLIENNVDDLGAILCSENGKPLREAKGEALQCAALLRWFAQRAEDLREEDAPSHSAEQRNYTIKQPIGIVACITPWNFPAAAVVVKAGAAIVTGCTTITPTASNSRPTSRGSI